MTHFVHRHQWLVLHLLTGLLTAWVLICWKYISSHHKRHPPLPSAQPAHSAVVDEKTVTLKAESAVVTDPAIVSASIAAVCGSDPATADRYEARNDALRAIARERNLASNDVAALMDYLASTNDVLRVERLAALKNDVMNLLRNQEPPPEI